MLEQIELRDARAPARGQGGKPRAGRARSKVSQRSHRVGARGVFKSVHLEDAAQGAVTAIQIRATGSPPGALSLAESGPAGAVSITVAEDAGAIEVDDEAGP